jgi:gas vesicle protein
MSDEGRGSGTVLLAFLLGGVVGAGVALIFAPQSGIETRKKLKDMADDVKDKTSGYIDETKDKMSSFVEQGKENIEGKKSIVKSAIEAGKEAYTKEKERLTQDKNA